ncbi:MAG: LamG-like jellyroll fold domain-containing protein, partial [Deltaproteobacteria bacterium]
GKNLTKGNSPTYSSDVCLPTVGGTPNHMSIAFTGSPQDYFLLNTPLSTATTNFVLEAFVKAVDSTSSARLVYNGSQFSSVNGFGFLDVNGVYEAAIGNGGSSLTTFGSASATTGWIHLALVRDGSTATFYVNGVANATSSVAPTTPTGSFTIGTTGKIAGIDEVRFSTFSSGAFQASDLLYSVPEPSIFAFFIFGTSLLLLRRRQ